MTVITPYFANDPILTLPDTSSYFGQFQVPLGPGTGVPAPDQTKLDYVIQNADKLVPRLHIDVSETAQSYNVQFTKSISADSLNLVNSWYLLSGLPSALLTAYETSLIQMIFSQVNFSFSDYKIKLFAKDRARNQYDLIIHSQGDNLTKIISFDNYEELNFSKLIIDKLTVYNAKTNREEISLVITVPRNGRQIKRQPSSRVSSRTVSRTSSRASSRANSPSRVTKSLASKPVLKSLPQRLQLGGVRVKQEESDALPSGFSTDEE